MEAARCWLDRVLSLCRVPLLVHRENTQPMMTNHRRCVLGSRATLQLCALCSLFGSATFLTPLPCFSSFSSYFKKHSSILFLLVFFSFLFFSFLFFSFLFFSFLFFSFLFFSFLFFSFLFFSFVMGWAGFSFLFSFPDGVIS